jgi:hypothetical protein
MDCNFNLFLKIIKIIIINEKKAKQTTTYKQLKQYNKTLKINFINIILFLLLIIFF